MRKPEPKKRTNNRTHFEFDAMETFELVVKPDSYEMRRLGEGSTLKFATVLGAFAHAQLSMSEEHGEMLVHGDGIDEHVPLYRMS